MIPGTPFLLDYVWQKYGSFKFENLIKPSINLAKDGFPISNYLYQAFEAYHEKLSKFKSTNKISPNCFGDPILKFFPANL